MKTSYSIKRLTCPTPAGTEKKPLVSSPGDAGASALLTLPGQDGQQATPSGIAMQAFASQASASLTILHWHAPLTRVTQILVCRAFPCPQLRALRLPSLLITLLRDCMVPD